jgi:hypothetical protein
MVKKDVTALESTFEMTIFYNIPQLPGKTTLLSCKGLCWEDNHLFIVPSAS